MKYRKLRIAWSVAWGVVCLLLIALWVRSYGWYDTIYYVQSPIDFLELGSVDGAIFVADDDVLAEFGNVGPHPTQTSWYIIRAGGERTDGIPLLKLLFRDFVISSSIYLTPYWFLALSAAALTAAPWLRWRFSLRTLLILMTLVAVGLGVAVYALKN